METNELTVGENSINNPTETPPIPVNAVLNKVLRCLLDWLSENNNNQKNHDILTALASESFKKIDKAEDSRKFDKRDIAAACGLAEGEKDLGSWLKWPEVEKYWNARRGNFLSFAARRGLDHYPHFERKTTPGKNVTLYWISARPLTELNVNGVDAMDTANLVHETGEHSNKKPESEVDYQCTQPGDIACIFLLKPWLKNGKIVLKGWRGWSVALPFIAIAIGILGIVLLAVALVGLGPVNNKAIFSSLMLLGIAYSLWILLIQPMKHLLEDRVICADGVESWREKPGQLELVRADVGLTIHLVRYSSSCSICAASVMVEKGHPDFPRRLVGRCAESPREHVFSFDRVTRKGKALRTNAPGVQR